MRVRPPRLSPPHHLDAAEATSPAFSDNPASLAVSRKGDTEITEQAAVADAKVTRLSQQLVVTADALNGSEYELRAAGEGGGWTNCSAWTRYS